MCCCYPHNSHRMCTFWKETTHSVWESNVQKGKINYKVLKYIFGVNKYICEIIIKFTLINIYNLCLPICWRNSFFWIVIIIHMMAMRTFHSQWLGYINNVWPNCCICRIIRFIRLGIFMIFFLFILVLNNRMILNTFIKY